MCRVNASSGVGPRPDALPEPDWWCSLLAASTCRLGEGADSGCTGSADGRSSATLRLQTSPPLGRHVLGLGWGAALEAPGTEIVPVAIRRVFLDDPKKRTELEYIDWSRYTILPNTAGCRT